jgi:predicted membrane protein
MEKLNVRCHRHHQNGPAVALVLIIVGGLFLGFNLGLIPDHYRPILISWEMLLIVLGAGSVYKRHFVSGIVLLCLGCFFLLPKIISVSGDFVHIYWPVMLIVAGIILLLHRFINPKRYDFSANINDWHRSNHGDSTERTQSQSGFHKNVVFGNEKFLVLDPEFKGGDINVTFGEIIIDFRKTQLATSTVEIEINVQFGSVVVYVPSDWKIQLQVDNVFGGFEDKRIFIYEQEHVPQEKTLIIYGSIVFGGGELRN